MASSGCRHAVCSVRSVLGSLDHRRQLELLVVRIVALVSVVSLPVAQDLLIQLDDLVSLMAAAIVAHLMAAVPLVRLAWLRRAICGIFLHRPRGLPASIVLILRSLLIICPSRQRVQGGVIALNQID